MRAAHADDGGPETQPWGPEGVNSDGSTDNPAPAPQPTGTPVKVSRTHQELHKELLLTHRRGLLMCRRSELQLVLERRKREQLEREQEELSRSQLERVLLERQQRQQEQKQQEEQQEPPVLEFVKVRQNLRKIQQALLKPQSS